MEVYIVPQATVDQYQSSRVSNFAIYFTRIATGEFVINTSQILLDYFSFIPWGTFEKRIVDESVFEPDYTLPDPGPQAFVIPIEYQWLFPLDVNGYVIPIYNYQGNQKILYQSHIDWPNMQIALDSPEVALLKKAITPFLNFLSSATIINI